MVNLKGGASPSYITNNLVKSDTYVAFINNGFLKPMIQIYQLSDLENDGIQPELIKSKNIQWDPKMECSHINYLYINQKWYLLVGYVGFIELYNEDGSKRYFSSQAASSAENELNPLEQPAFMSSCIGFFGEQKDE
jgi:hypothetical protein